MPIAILTRILQISRPIFWPSTFFAFLLGVVFSKNPITTYTLFFAFLWSFPYSLWICTLNDLEDYESDRSNLFKGGISGAKITKNERGFVSNLAVISGIIIILPTLLTANLFLIGTSLMALLIPYLYSVRPFRLKERPPLDSFSNGAFVACVCIAGYVFNLNSSLGPVFTQIILGIFFGVSAIHIIGALRDYTSDLVSKVRTIAVVWGQRTSAIFAAILFSCTYLSIRTFPLEFRTYAIIGILVSIILAIRPNEKRSMQLGLSLIILFFVVSAYSLFLK